MLIIFYVFRVERIYEDIKASREKRSIHVDFQLSKLPLVISRVTALMGILVWFLLPFFFFFFHFTFVLILKVAYINGFEMLCMQRESETPELQKGAVKAVQDLYDVVRHDVLSINMRFADS